MPAILAFIRVVFPNPRPFKFNKGHLHEGAIKIWVDVLFLLSRPVASLSPQGKSVLGGRAQWRKEGKKGPAAPWTDVWTRSMEWDSGVRIRLSHDVTLLFLASAMVAGGGSPIKPRFSRQTIPVEAFKVESSHFWDTRKLYRWKS